MGLTIEEDIGQMAGAIWYALNHPSSIGPSGGWRARARS